MKPKEQKKILDYLKSLPTHLEIEAGGQRFYLVHGFSGENIYDEVWGRLELHMSNPNPGYQVVIGRMPMLRLIKPEEKTVGMGRRFRAEGRLPENRP